MIHYNYIDPADAKPGDLLFLRNNNEYCFELRICIDYIGAEKSWTLITAFPGTYYCNEIIDGKPTPALIQRFTGSSGKMFEIHGRTLVRTAGGIASVGKIKPYNDNTTGYFFETEINGKENVYGFDSSKFSGDNLKQAETERARLIEWLEEA